MGLSSSNDNNVKVLENCKIKIYQEVLNLENKPYIVDVYPLNGDQSKLILNPYSNKYDYDLYIKYIQEYNVFNLKYREEPFIYKFKEENIALLGTLIELSPIKCGKLD
jgi:hypothetical protein